MQVFACPMPVGVTNVPGRDKGRENFLNEKGIALGQRGNGLKELSMDKANRIGGELVLSKDGLKHSFDLDMRQALKCDFLIEPLAVKLRQPMSQAEMHLVAAIGRQDEQRVGCAVARQVIQELETRFIAPMDILYSEQHGLFRSYTGEEVRKSHEQAALFLFWLQRRRPAGWQRYEIKIEQRQVACEWLQVGGVRDQQFFRL